jgi:hypothetical protein
MNLVAQPQPNTGSIGRLRLAALGSPQVMREPLER